MAYLFDAGSDRVGTLNVRPSLEDGGRAGTSPVCGSSVWRLAIDGRRLAIHRGRLTLIASSEAVT
ncbi:MAG: hypothetical protein JF606_03835 [Burkholderiales bacterium]|nr:hypothetical protein [Burkholderiales bacterium]